MVLIKKIYCFFGLLIVVNALHAQKDTYLLKKHEVQLLTLLLKDTIHNTTITVNNAFNFGQDIASFTNSNVIKKGKEVFIQPLGTGKLLKATYKNNHILVERIDQTLHSGVNFFTQNFFIKDTLYQVGGLGFWQIRGIINYFSTKTHQWELIQANRAVPCYFDDQKDAVMHFNEGGANPKLYVSNSYYYPNYPSSFETTSTDSCYVFDFNTKNWTALGKLTPEYKKLFDLKHSHEMDLHIDNLFIFQCQLDFFWANFEQNKLGKFNNNENNRLREIWLSSYNDDKIELKASFQFNLGNELYFMKLMKDDQLSWTKTNLNINELNTNKYQPIYTNKVSFWEALVTFFYQQTTVMVALLSILLLGIGFIINFYRRLSMPKEVKDIFYQNFFNALSIIEKELIEALYENTARKDTLSTKKINKIIGVQQKDILTQNKNRSDHFLKINQKFKMSTQNTDSLFIKTRDSEDKRQFNYSLNPIYLFEIEKLFKK